MGEDLPKIHSKDFAGNNRNPPRTSGKQIIGTDNLVADSAQGILIIGNRNVIGERAENISIVQSSGCTVAGGLKNVYILNSSGITVLESNVSYHTNFKSYPFGSVVSNPSVDSVGAITITGKTNDANFVIIDPAGSNITYIPISDLGSYNANGYRIIVKHVGASGTVIINPAGSITIDGATTYTLSSQYQSVTIVFDGTNWRVESEYDGTSGGGVNTLTQVLTAGNDGGGLDIKNVAHIRSATNIIILKNLDAGFLILNDSYGSARMDVNNGYLFFSGSSYAISIDNRQFYGNAWSYNVNNAPFSGQQIPDASWVDGRVTNYIPSSGHTALSVIGRSANSTGADADIASVANMKYVMLTSGTTILFNKPDETYFDLFDTTVNDVSTTKHGFVPKATNTGLKVLLDTGAYSTPPSGDLVYSNTAASTAITANGVETTFTVPVYSIPAGSLVAGSIIRLKMWGIYTTAGIAPTINMKIKLAGTTYLATGAITAITGVTNGGWFGDAVFTIYTIGASGTVDAQAYGEFATAATTGLSVNVPSTGTQAIDTTVAQAVTVTVTWGQASCSIQLRGVAIYIENLSTQATAGTFLQIANNLSDVNSAATSRTNLGVLASSESSYTPTLFNTTNVAASVAYLTNYTRVGNIVHVFGRVDIDTTTTNILTELGMAIPIASAIANIEDLAGTAITVSNVGVTNMFGIYGDAANNMALFVGRPASVANIAYSFHFSYRVI